MSLFLLFAHFSYRSTAYLLDSRVTNPRGKGVPRRPPSVHADLTVPNTHLWRFLFTRLASVGSDPYIGLSCGCPTLPSSLCLYKLYPSKIVVSPLLGSRKSHPRHTCTEPLTRTSRTGVCPTAPAVYAVGHTFLDKQRLKGCHTYVKNPIYISLSARGYVSS